MGVSIQIMGVKYTENLSKYTDWRSKYTYSFKYPQHMSRLREKIFSIKALLLRPGIW